MIQLLLNRTRLMLLLLMVAVSMQAENWDYVCSSGLYYYGMGHGSTEKEASDMALAELASMIATHVSNEFIGLTDETKTNGQADHKSQVLNCVKTYSQATLRNLEKWVEKKGDSYVGYCHMKRSELEKIFEERTAKAKDMLLIAQQAEERGKVDMALQYYYWSYSLIRSLQRPNEVKNADGKVLINWIPIKIDEILGNVTAAFEKRDNDYVDLLFNYKGKPVSSLEFSYNDGRAMCQGTAKDGRGMIEMIPGYETQTYHLSIEYECKGQARGDAEMQSVLAVVPKKVFPKAEIKVTGKGRTTHTAAKAGSDKTGLHLKPAETQLQSNATAQAEVVAKVISAIQRKVYTDANSCFTFDGLEMYNKLIAYGTGRVVGTPDIKFFKSANGNTVARGLQMSFSFANGKTKKTFVEDVAFTLNAEGKIEAVAFGLGQVAENDILCRNAPGWTDETRELLMEFLESYKTAYCLERIDYIREIFADDAVIIIGNVARRRNATPGQSYQERPISIEGQEHIRYNRYTKDEYLRNLKRCFDGNEFINIRFTNNDIQWLQKYADNPDTKEMFAIQIGQEYSSSTYSDKGYLFLLVNLTDHNQPQIKIRTWQPNEVDMSKLYKTGDFYNE